MVIFAVLMYLLFILAMVCLVPHLIFFFFAAAIFFPPLVKIGVFALIALAVALSVGWWRALNRFLRWVGARVKVAASIRAFKDAKRKARLQAQADAEAEAAALGQAERSARLFDQVASEAKAAASIRTFESLSAKHGLPPLRPQTAAQHKPSPQGNA